MYAFEKGKIHIFLNITKLVSKRKVLTYLQQLTCLDLDTAAASQLTVAVGGVVDPSSADEVDTAGKEGADPCNRKGDSMVGIDPGDMVVDPQDMSAPAHLELAAASLHHSCCPHPPVSSAPELPFFGGPLRGSTLSLSVVVVEC